MSKKRKVNTVQKSSTMDAFSNPAARLGFGTLDLLQGTSYPLTRLTQNYQLLTSMYRDNWIVQNIINTIPNDIIRKWYKINSKISDEYRDSMKKLERKTQLRKKILLGMYWGRLYGGAVGVILIKGQNDLSQPLDLDTIYPGSFLGLQILDRWSGVFPDGELVTDPSDPDFGLPLYYTIRNEEKGQIISRVHHSRVVRFIGRELPWLEQIAELYWGESEIEAVYNEIVKRDNISTNIAGLTFRANTNTMEIDGIDQLLGASNTEMQRRFFSTMQAQSIMESNFGMRVINKGDAIHNTQYSFAGLPEVYDRAMMDVAGAAKTPVTKLFGRSPAGMNATGESDLQNYYDYIDGLRETDFRDIIERLLPIMALSAWGVIPDDLEISMPPMWTPGAKEIAEIAKQKTDTVISAFQAGLTQADTAQKELQKLEEETGMFGSISDEDIKMNKGKTFQDVTALRDPLMGLSYEYDTQGVREEEPFESAAEDSYTFDYSPNQPRDKNGRWAGGGLTAGGESGTIQSSPKTIGKNGGTLRAEDMPEIRSSKGNYRIVPGTKVTGIYNFAGKDAQKPLRVEEHLIRQYGGEKGKWQHTAGNAMIDFGNGPQKAHIHWFQEPSVGIVGAKVKEG